MSKLPGEFELIARYFAPLARGFPGAYGLRDDAAVIAPAPAHELVVKTDAIVEDVHFLPTDAPDLVARKALRVNLSDLAAKGAVLRAYMLDLMLPMRIDEAWVAAFARGLAQDQAEYGVHLIGGDTDSTPGPVAIAITAFGEVLHGCMIRRGGARAGDGIFVTGTIGDAALGIEVLRGALPDAEADVGEFLVDRYRLPRPRVAFGQQLVEIATAAIDISDGLLADLRHVCEVSGVAAVVDASCVPLSAAARRVLAMRSGYIRAVLTGGDDYEILFTAPPAAGTRLSELSRALDVPVTAIGRVEALPPATQEPVVVLNAGIAIAPDSGGWTHF